MKRFITRKALCVVAGVALASALLVALALVAEHGKRESAMEHEALPYYSSADLWPRWDWLSRQHDVGRFALVDQDGQAFDQSVLDRGPTVVSFFFTACVTVCPISIDMLKGAQARMAAKHPGAAPAFLSISVSPLTDDPAALRKYAHSVQLAPAWRLATGDPAKVVALAQRGLFSDIATIGPDGLPTHLTRALLIDRQHRVRGIYDAAMPTEIIRLQHDVARLADEA